MNPTGNNDRERVLDATDIVRLVGDHVQLRGAGKEYVGLCPFHDDKKPSMTVSPQKQIYKCFSCGAGGTAYDFVMNYHKLTFPEALKMLADRAGIELTPFKGAKQGGEPGKPSMRKRLLAANELALSFFRHQLNSDAGQSARDYVAKRGISDEMVEQFRIGYAPHAQAALAEAVARKKLDRQAFLEAGLISDRYHGDDDRLRHRLIFPIADEMGNVIAFGGRVLPGYALDDKLGEAKYLNSPETPLFNKSQTLYGIDLAKKAIIDSKTAVIVEGYTDVVACHQHGRRNVVAALGVAFTNEHVTRLRRFCEKVVLVFDGDAAGHKAADRAVEVLLKGEVDVAVAILPEGQDPDELLATDGGEAVWDSLVENAPGAMQYLLSQFEQGLADAGTMTGKQNLATRFLERLAGHEVASLPAIRRALVVSRLSQLLHMPEAEVLSELKRLKPQQRRFTPVIESTPDADERGMDAGSPTEESVVFDENERPQAVSSSRLKSMALAERQLVVSLLRDNDLFHGSMPDGTDFCEAVPPGDVAGEGARVYQLLHDRFADGEGLTLTGLLAELAERGWDRDRRWLTMADVELDLHLGDEPAKHTDRLRTLFLESALAIARHRRRQAYEQDRRSVLQEGQQAGDPIAAALAKAGRAQRLAEQRLGEDDPGRIASGNSG